MSVLTPRQRDVLRYITRYWNEHDASPKLDEVADYLGVNSASSAYEHVKKLREKGYITPGTHEMGRLIPTGKACPCCGAPLDD